VTDELQPIRAYLARWTPRIEEELDRLLPPAAAEPRAAHEAMRYSVQAGGKRLRPALVLLGARAAGGLEDDVLGVACAVECVHTYSLIHDDLPAMDDDDTRRGRPSCHRQFGEAVAILAGDALNTLAFELLARTAPDSSRVPALVQTLCRAAGTAGMVGGQMRDLEAAERGRADPGRTPDVEEVRAIHTGKTAALFTASLQLGAIAVDAEPELVAALAGAGERLGLAFQIVDDVLDEAGDASVMGKSTGKDRSQGKATYPAAVGVAQSRALAADLVRDATAALDGRPGGDLLASLGAFVLERDL